MAEDKAEGERADVKQFNTNSQKLRSTKDNQNKEGKSPERLDSRDKDGSSSTYENAPPPEFQPH